MTQFKAECFFPESSVIYRETEQIKPVYSYFGIRAEHLHVIVSNWAFLSTELN